MPIGALVLHSKHIRCDLAQWIGFSGALYLIFQSLLETWTYGFLEDACQLVLSKFVNVLLDSTWFPLVSVVHQLLFQSLAMGKEAPGVGRNLWVAHFRIAYTKSLSNCLP